MNSEAEAFFVKKEYQIYIESITLKKNCQFFFFSANSGANYKIPCETTISIKQKFEVTSVDVIYKAVSNCDKDVKLDIDLGEKEMVTVVFDVSKEKIKKIQSGILFKKGLSILDSFIFYKFISCRTCLLKKDEVEGHLQQKGGLVQRIVQQVGEGKKQKEEFCLVLEQKNSTIKKLHEQIEKLNNENFQITKKIDRLNELMIGKGFSIQTNLKNVMEIKEIDRIKQKYQSIIQQCQRKISTLQQENESLYQRINALMENRSNTLYENSTVKSEFELQHNSHSSKSIQNDFKVIPTQGIVQEKLQSDHIFIENSKNKLEDNTVLTQNKTLQDLPSSMKPELKENSKQYSYFFTEIEKTEKEGPKLLRERSHIEKERQKNEIHKSEREKSSTQENTNNIHLQITSQQFLEASSSREIGNEKCILEVKTLNIKLTAKDKEIKVLEEQIANKVKAIEKMKEKEVMFNKNLKFLQNQKARLLSNLANNTSTTTDNIDTLTVLQELKTFNKELLKEKEEFLHKIDDLMAKIQNQQDQIEEYKKMKTQADIKIEELKQQKSLYEKDLRLSTLSKVSSSKERQIPEAYLKKFKNQLATCEKQLAKVNKEKDVIEKAKADLEIELQSFQGLREKGEKEADAFKMQIAVLEYEKKSMTANLVKVKQQYQESLILNTRYLQMESKFEAVNKTAVRVEAQFNKKVKKDELDFFKKEMEKVIGMLFVSINDFQVDFYSVLQNSFKINSLALGKYYQSLIQIQTENYRNKIKANGSTDLTSDQIKQLQKIKQKIEKEKMVKERELQQQKKILQKKKQTRLLTLDQELKSFEDGVMFVEKKIEELLSYKKDICVFYAEEASKYMQLPDKITELKGDRSMNNSRQSKLFSNSFLEGKDVIIKQLEDEEGRETEQAIVQLSSQNRVMEEVLDAKQSMKKTILNSKQQSFLGGGSISNFARFGSSVAFKQSILKESQSSPANRMFGTQESTIMTFKHAMEISRELIQERAKSREIKLENIKTTSKLTTNLFEQKIKADILTVKHNQRERELQKEYDKTRVSFQMEIKQCNKKILSLEETLKSKDIELEEKIKQIEQYKVIDQELMEAVQQLQLVEQEKVELKETIFQLLEKCEKYMDQETHLQAQLQSVRSQFADKGKTFDQLIEQKTSLMDLAQIHKNKEIEQLKIKIQKLKEELEDEYHLSIRLEQEKNSIVQNVAEEKTKLQEKYQQLKDSLTTILEEGKRKEEQVQFLNEENQKLRGGVDLLSQRAEESQKQLLRALNRIEVLQKEKIVLENFDRQLQIQMQRKKEELKKIHDKQALQIQKWQEEYSKLQIRIGIAVREEEQARKEGQQLRQRLLSVEKKIQQQENLIINLQKQLSIKTVKAESLKQINDSLQKEGSKYFKEISHLQELNQQLQQQLKPPNNKKNLKSQLLASHFGRKTIARLNSNQSHSSNHIQSKKESPLPEVLPEETEDEFEEQITYQTPLFQFLPQKSEYSSFASKSVSSLIKQIIALRKQSLSHGQSISFLQEQLLEAQQIMKKVDELVQKGKQKDIQIKELRGQKSRLEVRLKHSEEILAKQKAALAESESQNHTRWQEILHFSKLSGQLHLDNQQLRIEMIENMCCEIKTDNQKNTESKAKQLPNLEDSYRQKYQTLKKDVRILVKEYRRLEEQNNILLAKVRRA